MPHITDIASHAYGWLSKGHGRIITAGVVAVGLIASVSIFAAGENWPTSCSAGQSQPFYRLYSNDWKDHFYTMSKPEAESAISGGVYKLEGTAGYIFPDKVPGTVPLYRMWNGDVKDHFYTTSADEYNAVTWYQKEGVAGYVFKDQVFKSVPLYRMYNNDVKDHFYTNSTDEWNAVTWYQKEGVIGYVFEGCENPPTHNDPPPTALPTAAASPGGRDKASPTPKATPTAVASTAPDAQTTPKPTASATPGGSTGQTSDSDRANPAGRTVTVPTDQESEESAETKGAGALPSTGTATWMLLGTVALAAAVYYGRRLYLHRRQR